MVEFHITTPNVNYLKTYLGKSQSYYQLMKLFKYYFLK